MKFTPTNRHNPCPLCSDISGDCRHLENGLILCHDFIDDDPQIAGWRWKKPSQCQTWGVFAPDEREIFDRDEWERRKQERQLERERQRKAQFLTALEADERDKAIRRIHKHIGLSSRHRQMLRERGLSDKQIDDGLFFSIAHNQEIPALTPPNLPGVHWRGDRLATKDFGFACVAFDFQGRAIGWQIRQESDEQKYKWARGSHSSHLPNGELPISFAQPETITNERLAFVEGILKPVVASHRWEQRFIGASGGHFSGSSEQIKAIIEAEKKRLKTLVVDKAQTHSEQGLEFVPPEPKNVYRNYPGVTDLFTSDGKLIIELYPDAGDVLNRHVMKRWERQIEFLRSIGCEPVIVWWGQVAKNHNDCDEIGDKDPQNLEYLTPETFLRRTHTEQAKKAWRVSKTLTATEQVNHVQLTWQRFDENAATFVKSYLGSGKTHNTIKWIDENRSWLEYQRLYFLGYRNNLLLQLCFKIRGLEHIHELSSSVACIGDPDLWAAFCVDSILKFEPEHFDGAVIVLDEVVSVIKHLLYSRTIKNRELVIERFIEALNRSDRIICLDANLQNWAVEFIQKSCFNKKIVTVENQFVGKTPLTYWLEGSINESERIKPNDRKPWIQKLLGYSEPIAICSDSQRFLEALELLLIEQGKQGIRIDKKTSSEKIVKAFLTDPTAWIGLKKPDFVLYSPSAESGLDLPITGYFKAHFGFFFGVLDCDSILQMMGRIRDVAVDRYLWVSQRSVVTDSESIKSPFAETLRKVLNEQINLDLNKLLSGEARGTEVISQVLEMVKRSLDLSADAALKLQAIWNYERSHLRECVLEMLRERGYEVVPILEEKIAHDSGYKIATEEVKNSECRDIFQAPEPVVKIDGETINLGDSWTEQCTQIKAYYYKRLPGIQDTPQWSSELIRHIRFDEPKLLDQLERYYFLQHFDVTEKLALKKFKKWHEKNQSSQKECIWLYKNQHSLISAIKESGIEAILSNPDGIYTNDSLEIQETVKRCRKKSIRLNLGSIGRLSPIQYVGKILRLLGLEWESEQIRLDDGTRLRQYRVDWSLHQSEYGQIIRDRISYRWQKFLLDWQEINWFEPQKFVEKTGESDETQTRSEQGSEVVTPDPKNLYKNKPDVTDKNPLAISTEQEQFERPPLVDYQEYQPVWVRYRDGFWYRGWISKTAKNSQDFVRVWCDAVRSYGLMVVSPLDIAPGEWVLSG